MESLINENRSATVESVQTSLDVKMNDVLQSLKEAVSESMKLSTNVSIALLARVQSNIINVTLSEHCAFQKIIVIFFLYLLHLFMSTSKIHLM